MDDAKYSKIALKGNFKCCKHVYITMKLSPSITTGCIIDIIRLYIGTYFCYKSFWKSVDIFKIVSKKCHCKIEAVS